MKCVTSRPPDATEIARPGHAHPFVPDTGPVKEGWPLLTPQGNPRRQRSTAVRSGGARRQTKPAKLRELEAWKPQGLVVERQGAATASPGAERCDQGIGERAVPLP